jgi:predicted AAA+ superfamily ATPase
MYVKRLIQEDIYNSLFEKKAIIIYGARQTGKSTMVRELLKNSELSHIWLNADEPDIASMLTGKNSAMLKTFFGNHRIVVIDEAQRIKNIGLTIKLITDNYPEYQIIATGSSSFDLANEVNEPLTGRKWEYRLFPFSFEEMASHKGLLEESRLLEHRLVYGMYPDVVLNPGKAEKIIRALAESYLYKDILAYEGIRHSNKLIKLLKALALQVGSEISYNELSGMVEMDNKTTEKYIDILEQSFIIFRLHSFSKNLRTELKKAKKVYFWDNGIRNSLTGNFDATENRIDTGILWENFFIAERYKYILNHGLNTELFFWRTQLQQEIDLIEVSHNKINAYELKWNPKKKAALSKSFSKNYPTADFKLINRENFIPFLTKTTS